jgi:hypothetical protein
MLASQLQDSSQKPQAVHTPAQARPGPVEGHCRLKCLSYLDHSCAGALNHLPDDADASAIQAAAGRQAGRHEEVMAG